MATKMNKAAREFAAQEEATRAARTKAAKKAKRQRRGDVFAAYLAQKAERMEANGNLAGAAVFRTFWGRIGNGRYAKALRKIAPALALALTGCASPTAPEPPPEQVEVRIECTLTLLEDGTIVSGCVEGGG